MERRVAVLETLKISAGSVRPRLKASYNFELMPFIDFTTSAFSGKIITLLLPVNDKVFILCAQTRIHSIKNVNILNIMSVA